MTKFIFATISFVALGAIVFLLFCPLGKKCCDKCHDNCCPLEKKGCCDKEKCCPKEGCCPKKEGYIDNCFPKKDEPKVERKCPNDKKVCECSEHCKCGDKCVCYPCKKGTCQCPK